jgi:hypothetical protein
MSANDTATVVPKTPENLDGYIGIQQLEKYK